MNKASILTTLRTSIGISLLLISVCLIAGTHHQFQNGKLLDITSEERLYEGTTYKRAIYQVQIGDVVYSCRGERVHKHSGDPGHGLIVGDPVQAAIDGNNLFLQRPDGKEIKAEIIKRQRAKAE